jgi:hydrogenase expression/formation protein HypC
MCLGIPGKLLEIHEQDSLPMGKVEFGGIAKDICLAYVPEAEVGDYVLVHVGFAISRIDEQEAQEIFSYIEQIGDLSELEGDEPLPPGTPPASSSTTAGPSAGKTT